MKYLVTGAAGQLGSAVVAELARRGHEVIGTVRPGGHTATRPESTAVSSTYRLGGSAVRIVPLNITDREAVRALIVNESPYAVIHCAAWTGVDPAEEPANHEAVKAANADATRYIAEACRETGSRMLYVSTEYVFDGRGVEPWQEDCASLGPLNWYGETKLMGERAVTEILERYYILRISWAFGPGGVNFVDTMLKVAETHDEVRVVDDQVGVLTYCPDVARLMVDMCGTEKYGVYHATNSGEPVSRYEVVCEAYRQAGISTRVVPVSTAEYGHTPATRPLNSRLGMDKLTRNGLMPLPDWHDALSRFLQERSR